MDARDVINRWQAIVGQVATLRRDLAQLESQRVLAWRDAWRQGERLGVTERRALADGDTAALQSEIFKVRAELDCRLDEIGWCKAAAHAITTYPPFQAKE